MKAVRIHRFGGPEVLQLDEIDKPAPVGDKLLIRVVAASVNPVDYKIRKGGYPMVKDSDLPATLGRDVAGVIQTAGGGFEAGDEVYAQLDWADGAYAEYALCAPVGMAPKPASLDMTTAAGVPLAATTAWQALFDHGGLKAGQRVLIHGGSGGVGGFGVQFAKAKGAYVIATASGDGVRMARDYGADEVVDYKTQRFEDVAKDLDLVFDLIGGETQDRSFDLLKRGGALISIVQAPDKDRLAKAGLKGERCIVKPNGGQLRQIGALIDAGKVKVVIAKTYPLAQAADAHRFLEDKHPLGKVVLTVG